MTLTLYTYRCPYCDSGDMGEAVGRCLNCAGAARITREEAGDLPPEELERLPLPPGVRQRACGRCAFRPGSPELEENGERLPVDEPFWCHVGMGRGYDGQYVPPAWIDLPGGRRFPVGTQICHGWWMLKTGGPMPGPRIPDTAD